MSYHYLGQTQATPCDSIVYTYEGQGISPALIAQLAPGRATFQRRLLSQPSPPYLMTSWPHQLERLSYQEALQQAFRPGFLVDWD